MLQTVIATVFAIIPALFLLRYYYKQDKLKPEPKGLITKVFFIGVLSTFVLIVLEGFLGAFEKAFAFSPVLIAAFRAFLVAGLCEEWFKFLIVRHVAYKNINFDEIMDGVVYTVVASLGFACMENIMYSMQGGVPTAILRAFTAVPMHAVASGMMGYYIGMAKFAGSPQAEKALFRKGLWLAIFIHGLYDFFIFAAPDVNGLLAYAIFPLLVVVFFSLRQKIKLALAEDVRTGHNLTPPPLPTEPPAPSGQE
jgi:protease PrsW